jgi:ABC-2 type transport system permease protein
MITLVNIELFKIFRKWRTYISFIAIAGIITLIHMGMYYEGQDTVNHMTRNIQQSFIFVGNLLNGYLISYIILGTLYVHMPFLITLVAGDLLAGEATAGTYRLLITRPVSRFELITAKFIAGAVYTAILVTWMAVLSLGAGLIIFGSGELIVANAGHVVIFSRDDVLWRFLTAYGFAVLSMLVITSLAFFLSSLVQNAIGPIITTMAIIIVLLAISALNLKFFEPVVPYFFTSHTNVWTRFFSDTVDYSAVTKSASILLAYIAGFFGLTLFIFSKKDILS